MISNREWNPEDPTVHLWEQLLTSPSNTNRPHPLKGKERPLVARKVRKYREKYTRTTIEE
jgi:hypothetical protein